VKAAPLAAGYDWTGWFAGGHMGYAFGRSSWNATSPGGAQASGSLELYQSPNSFAEEGSFLEGAQAGYNRMLANRMVLGVEADASFPAWPNLAGIGIGGASAFVSPTLGASTFSETVLASGTLRGRVGYAPGAALFYATGGLAWSYNQQSLAAADGTVQAPLLWRFGWAAGLGIEAPLAPQWTVKAEYLYTGYPSTTVAYPAMGQRIGSDFALHELRLGLNYHFGDPPTAALPVGSASVLDADRVNFHGQFTYTQQGYPGFRSPYSGQNSLPAHGPSRETADATLSTGIRLWQGAELWANPEIDQGFGFADTHGVAGFTSAESYKLGSATPYARIQRAFIRQTINLGGEEEKVDGDFTQFAGIRSTDRLVLTVGRFGIVDIFDTNRFANNPKSDFLNWSVVNTGSFDYAGDGWGYSYGAAAEWYTGRWTVRGGVFDLSNTPAGSLSPTAYALDPTFRQFQLVGEIEERHELWGLPGKIKLTGFLSRGRAGTYAAAIALSNATGQAADTTAVRGYTGRPGLSVNLEQQLTETFGVFARAGWADGQVEPWDFTDVDRTIEIGASLSGKSWGRPDDAIGVAGVVNGISAAHAAFLDAGGLGILIGDGRLPNPRTEKILEAYYSYALDAATRLTFDYQFIADPAYNADRGPVNVFSGRVHWQF